MTVQELIEQLETVENKELQVVIPFAIGYNRGYNFIIDIESADDAVELLCDYRIKWKI